MGKAERRPFSALAKRALDQLRVEHGRTLNELLLEIAKDHGIDPADGWEVDMQNSVFVKPAPPE